jgi:hypothetical protein
MFGDRTPRDACVLAAAVAFGALDCGEHEDVGYRLELAELAPDGGRGLGAAARALLLAVLLCCVA